MQRSAYSTRCFVRSRVLRGVGQGQHQRDTDFRASGRPHLRQDVQESGRQHDGAQQPADEAPDRSAGWRGRGRRAWRSTEPPAVPAMLVGCTVLAPAASPSAIRRASTFTVGILGQRRC